MICIAKITYLFLKSHKSKSIIQCCRIVKLNVTSILNATSCKFQTNYFAQAERCCLHTHFWQYQAFVMDPLVNNPF